MAENLQMDGAGVQPIPHLDKLGNVPKTYEHHNKLVTPGNDLRLPHAFLKWYDICRSDVVLSQELCQESRAFVQSEVDTGRLSIENQLGFVLLHSCETVVFLIVSTWCHANELWKTVYLKDLTRSGDFTLFPLETHVPTFCVWELAPVWHEQQAWVRYLCSKRDEAAKYAYLNDRLTGLI